MEENLRNIIQEPFDPASIDVEKKNMSVNSLITMLQNDVIDMEPAFQRKKDLWDDTRQSRLIESLLLKLPLPSMYFEYDAKRKKYIVIDGLQRLCAIKHFAVDKDLRLKKLEFIGKDYDGMGYDDLIFQDKLSIGLEEIAVNILKNGTPEFAKFIIFKRLNSGGTNLENAEIRNALYPGKGLDLIHHLAESPDFREIGFNPRRMKDRECILRFFAFLINGYEAYTGQMDSFLTQSQRMLNEMCPDRLADLERQFFIGLHRSKALFGEDYFRLPSKKQPSASLFDALMVVMASLNEATFNSLAETPGSYPQRLYDRLAHDADFNDAVGSKSDRKGATLYRYNTIQSLTT